MTVKKFSFSALCCIAATAFSTNAAQADIVFDFDSPVVTGSSQAPGVWYTDRYAPAGFESQIMFNGDNRLLQTISAADGGNNRPASFSSPFYNTQGRKYDIDGTYSMSIDLFVDDTWASTGRRMAGFWGTAFDALDTVSGFPIIEFTSTPDGTGTGRFRGWDVVNGGWIDLGLPTGFTYDEFYRLTIELDTMSDTFTYKVGDISFTQGAGGSAEIGNVILQGHNTDDGVGYEIYWDNFTARNGMAPVPEPASMTLCVIMLACLAGAAVYRKRKPTAALVA